MKLIILIISLFIFSLSAQGQSKESVVQFFDKDWNEVNEADSAYYYRTVENTLVTMIVRDYFKSGKLQMVAGCRTLLPKLIREGEVKYYYENGQLQEEGPYANDSRTGLHKTYYKNGKPKTEVVYDEKKTMYRHYWSEKGDDLIIDGNAIICVDTTDTSHRYMQIENHEQIATFSVELPRGDTLYGITESPPEYKGGYKKMMKKISQNFVYPVYARRRGIQGTVYIQFIIDREGRMKEPSVLRGIDTGCDAEALRVAKKLTTWQPAKHKNKPVATRYALPIVLTLDR